MIIIVKLILVCQTKDDKIPQLIPLFWIISTVLTLLILILYLKTYGNFFGLNVINNLNEFIKKIEYKWYW